MEKTETQLQELANDWMSRIVPISSTLNEQLHESIRLGTNLDTRKVRGLTYSVIVAFSSYVVQQKLLSNIGFERKEKFANIMRERYLSIQKSVTSGNHDEKWLETTKNMYDGPFSKMSLMKGPITNYLKQSLAAVFAHYTDLEFVEDSFFNRFKPSSKHRISIKILDEFALLIWAKFMDLEVESVEGS